MQIDYMQQGKRQIGKNPFTCMILYKATQCNITELTFSYHLQYPTFDTGNDSFSLVPCWSALRPWLVEHVWRVE